MTDIRITSARVIDAIYAADGLRGVLSARDTLVGTDLEAPLRRLFAGACAAMASRVDGVVLKEANEEYADFALRTSVSAIYLETALMWALLGIARPDGTADGAKAVESLGAAIAAAEAAACPAHRMSWF